ncbi:MAG TPA: thioredoxin family protein [Gemmataceae bacterium]|jgi:peroxiredoxin|nr:thioredoxin family protein [Gemmataceae bacterium]
MQRIILAVLLVPTLSLAGEFNKKLSIGDVAPAWKDLPGTDDKKHALADLQSKDFVVVVFTCNSCACSEEYEDRIIAFAKKYADKVALVAINVNTIPADRLDAMKKKAVAKKFSFPYLYDESQKIAQDYGAIYTPEFFVIDKDRRIVYMGAMDDKTKADDVKDKYLESAVDALLKGDKPATKETPAHGCLIRFKRSRD